MGVNILVTGGAGFIGSNFISYLFEHYPQYRVVCLDKLTYAGRRETLTSVMGLPNFRFVQADICNQAAVEQLFAEERFDIVINFAAESHVDRSIENPLAFVQTNVLGTGVLLEACRKYKVKRFHQVSTDEVYGDLPLAGGKPFTEQSPLRPSSPYSSSKAGADLLVQSYMRTYGLPATISRSSNNYGPYQLAEKLIPLMIGKALRKEPMPIYGSGLNVRDWLHVDDHCRALDVILHKGVAGQVYNVGGGAELQNIQLVRKLCQLLGVGEELIAYVADRKGHDKRYALDCSKLRDELGWQPQVELENGLKNTVEWYLANREWLSLNP